MTHNPSQRHRRPGIGLILALCTPVVFVLAILGTWMAGGVASADSGANGTNTAVGAATSQAYQNAITHLPKPSLPAAQRTSEYQSALSESECMQANGITNYPMPNPNFGDGNTPPMIVGAPGSGVDVGSPQYLAAEGACSPYPNHGVISTTPLPNP